MKIRTKKITLALVAILTLVAVVPVEAQRAGPPGRRGQAGQERLDLELRVRQRMGEVMRRQLGLSDEEDQALSDVVRSFEEQRRELDREGQAIRRRVEALMLEGGDDVEEAAQLVTRMSDLRRREVELFSSEQAELLEILTPLQLLRFQTLREEMGERIRRLRQGGRGNAGLPG